MENPSNNLIISNNSKWRMKNKLSHEKKDKKVERLQEMKKTHGPIQE